MKAQLPFATLIFAVGFIFVSCSDQIQITRTYTILEPVYMTSQALRASVEVVEPVELARTGKIYLYKKFLLINDPGKGIHVINNENPSDPEFLKFINIPGNYDMAVKGDILFADSYIDLLAFDLRDINNISIIERVESIFLSSFTYQIVQDSGIIVDWKEVEKVEVTNGEEYYPSYIWGGPYLVSFADKSFRSDMAFAATPQPSNVGIGGSMARFTIVNDFLYTIDNWKMYVFNISNLQKPKQEISLDIGWGIETIFPYKSNLFIGSQTGMIIYDISKPASPQFVSNFAHARRCDPVVVQDDLAYVTLRGGNECGGFTNQLDIVDIRDLKNPVLLSTHPMEGPYGLGIDKNTLFVCDGSAGLKVFNVTQSGKSVNLSPIKTYGNMDAYDVIPFNNILILIGKDGLHQFDYSNPMSIVLLSRLTVKSGS